jgi:hypothetical protein
MPRPPHSSRFVNQCTCKMLNINFTFYITVYILKLHIILISNTLRLPMCNNRSLLVTF